MHLIARGLPARWLADVPVRPDEPTARSWLEQELSKPEYGNAGPTVWDRFWDWVWNLFQNSGGPVPVGWMIVIAAIVIAVVIIVVTAGPLRLAAVRRAQPGAVFDVADLDAASYRRRADHHAEAGRWAEAIRDRFRGLVRDLQDRTVLDTRPGLTADEAAREAAPRFPEFAQALLGAATIFDDVCYGGRDGDAARHEAIRVLDDQLRHAKPVSGVAAAPALSAPR